jgi:hypothetical protein
VEAPEDGHLSPGVVAVPGEEIEPVFFFTFDVHVTVRGEDLAVDPVAEWPRVAVVGQRGMRCERREERVPVAVVDGGREPVHDGV